MPIKQINGSGFTKFCTRCGGEEQIDFTAIELGCKLGENACPDNIALPPCASCGAQEVLQVNFDAVPAQLHGTRFDLHRRAVNEIGKQLRETNRVHAEIRAQVEARPTPDQLLAAKDRSKVLPVPAQVSARRNRGGVGN
jgi:hypothetical protein